MRSFNCKPLGVGAACLSRDGIYQRHHLLSLHQACLQFFGLIHASTHVAQGQRRRTIGRLQCQRTGEFQQAHTAPHRRFFLRFLRRLHLLNAHFLRRFRWPTRGARTHAQPTRQWSARLAHLPRFFVGRVVVVVVVAFALGAALHGNRHHHNVHI